MGFCVELKDVIKPNSELYYYSEGKKIPLTIHTNSINIKYKENADIKNIESDLNNISKAKSLSTAELSIIKKQNVAKIIFNKNISKSDFAQAISDLKKMKDVANAVPALKYPQSSSPILFSDIFAVQFKKEISKTEIDEMNKQYGVEISKPISFLANGYLLKITNPVDYNILQIANQYYESGKVVFSHPDFIIEHQLKFTPNDQYFPNQWHLNNTGQSGIADEDIDAVEAWDLTQGDTNLIIAVIDEGIDIDHEDLSAKVVFPYNAIDGTDDPRPIASNESHGTATSGLAVAIGNNTIGVVGSAPNCKLMPIKLLDTGETTSSDADAFIYASDNGASVLSNSWGPEDNAGYAPIPDLFKAAMDYVIKYGRSGKGSTILFAAGNGNEDIGEDRYASYDKVIAVGASRSSATRATFSDYGEELDVIAPGSSLTTTDIMGSWGYSTSGNYVTNYFTGTSASTPVAAGVCGLIISANPQLNYIGVQNVLETTTDKIDTANANYDENGFSLKYGYGRINAYNAVSKAISMNDNTPPNAVTDLSIDPTTFLLSWTAPGDDGTSGTAYRYDFRLLTENITEDNFDCTVEFTDESKPLAAGSNQQMYLPPAFGNMEEGQTYYAAMKTYDDFGNLSNLSNVVSFRIHPRFTLESDNFESGLSQWTLDSGWALTTEIYHSAFNSLTDSPSGEYANNANKSAVFSSFDLTDAIFPALSFYEKYDIEDGYDYGYVEVSDNGGVSWSMPLSVSTGSQPNFTHRIIDLSDYAGQSDVRVRFRLKADVAVTADGWYIDDVKILYLKSEYFAVSDWMLY